MLGLCAALACLTVLAGNDLTRAADSTDVPSFRSTKDKDSKVFVKKVGTAIIKAARASPIDIELKKYEYKPVKGKKGRKQLLITMNYTGTFSKKVLKKPPFVSDIVVDLDTSDEDKWEVLDIKYKDDNKVSKVGYSEKKVMALKKQFNR